ncbi:hypothetical protein V9T40_008055 [Parthenolecanium corni]|uniref:Carboxylic ester hydrolase n=1 Tax=Parthenolecanium corni TaxID=536013 RepID=A0AAN9Y7Z3_9HEMI
MGGVPKFCGHDPPIVALVVLGMIVGESSFREGKHSQGYRLAGTPDIFYTMSSSVAIRSTQIEICFLNQLDPNDKLPVIVWIHGGEFEIGGGSTYEPYYFLDKRLVLITFNYRLNVLGFMHLDDEFLSGNYGMKDQVMVLRWVQKYIYLFGGNKEKVTLAGSSAGAVSVNWHMYSPQSSGLFHQAICQSGTAKSIWAQIPRHVAQKRANAIATMAGCVFQSIKENVECLRQVPAEDLVRISKSLRIWKDNPLTFGVVVESPTSDEPFVTTSPWTSTVSFTTEKPLMIGFTSDEGGLTVNGLLEDQGKALEELGENYKRLFPVLMTYQFNMGLISEEAVLKVTEKIRERYFKQEKIGKSTFTQIKEMLADSQVIYDTVQTLEKYKSPKYFYIYSHRNKHTFAELESNFLDTSGPVHSDDLISLFKLQNIFPDAEELDEADMKVSELMINLWTNFITKGDPNLETSSEPKWNPVNNDELYFYKIDVNPTFEKLDWEKSNFYEDLEWHSKTN